MLLDALLRVAELKDLLGEGVLVGLTGVTGFGEGFLTGATGFGGDLLVGAATGWTGDFGFGFVVAGFLFFKLVTNFVNVCI